MPSSRADKPSTTPVNPRRRRSQAERRGAMRDRLLKATLECLARDGYAATTVSSIVKRAGVSRGAHVHHYPSKEALILDAAEVLMRRAYRTLGELLLGIADEDDRLQALILAVWQEIFSTRMFGAFFELLIASQHDAGLARSLRTISKRSMQTVDKAIVHYFEPRGTNGEDIHDMFIMTAIMLGGMSAGAHIAQGPRHLDRYLAIWSRLMNGQVRARIGIRSPPPRPPDWDRAD